MGGTLNALSTARRQLSSWLLLAGVLSVLCSNALADGTGSVCYGTTSNGRLAYGCEMPKSGVNFSAYSTVARWLGRTWVHCDVAAVVDSAYGALAESHPDKRYVYGETGFRQGGEFKPHKTHRNGLSVDFMTPVLDADGRSVPLPTGVTNKYGYDIEFDASGNYDDLRIDYEALAAHLAALRRAAEEQGIGIWRVIFDPGLRPELEKTGAWPAIKDLKFSTKRSWVRHDEHYHVDFETDCQPLSSDTD